jgi:flagellar protein FlaG
MTLSGCIVWTYPHYARVKLKFKIESQGGAIMAISAISSAVSFETAKQPVERTTKVAEPVNTVEKVPVTETAQKVPAVNSGESGSGSLDQGKEQDKNANRVKDAVTHANNKLKLKQKHMSTRCEFSYHEPTGRISIKVMDKETDEVIREIPPEETLEMVEKMWELAGLIVDEHR